MDLQELGQHDCEQLVWLRDPECGLQAWIAIHSTKLGPAFGGIRRRAYAGPAEALEDALRLGEAMALKCAIAGIPGGGGKAVILQRPELDRAAAYTRLGRHIESLGGRFRTGPDVGTESHDLARLAAATQYVAHAPGAGGQGAGELTAAGVFAGIEAVAERLDLPSLDGATVVVQGLGAVGTPLVADLVAAGARVLVSDLRRSAVESVVARHSVQAIEPGEVMRTPCDVLAPCALGGVVDELSVPGLKARAIAGSANNQLASPQVGRDLFERGILYAPDFVINAGALVHGAWLQLEGEAPGAERIREIGARVGALLDESRRLGLPPERIAEQRARERIAAGPGPWFG
jgi:leucine dehydrogenase